MVWVPLIVWIVILERLQMALVRKLVKLAVQDNTKMSLEMLRANNAPLVSVRTTKDKRRASNAAPVNSTTLMVPSSVNLVYISLTLLEREETAVVSIVQWDGHPKTAVPNVSPAVRARLA